MSGRGCETITVKKNYGLLYCIINLRFGKKLYEGRC